MKHFLFPIFAVMLGSACSSGIETRISSSGVTLPKAEPYMITSAAETSAESRSAYLMVAENLTQKGFAIATEAPLHLEVTVDQRDASLALGSNTGPESLSAPKRKKPLQSCHDMEYRLGVTLTRVADGAEIYRGRAAEYHCKISMAEALPALVAAALADLGNPRGSYAVLRNAKE
jgi:hypothetical protein